jgi:5'-nucleotidase
MEILVTNDDGIESHGLHSLAEALQKIGNVHVIAPAHQQSAVGHALTIETPLRTYSYYLNGLRFGTAISGTPSDSVKLAVSALLEKKPDLVVSGINFGRNTSLNILYSGTVAAATEGMLLGIPSIAVSLDAYTRKVDTSIAAEYATMIAEKISEFPIGKHTFLNVNVPNLPKDKIKGIKITRLSRSEWKDHYEKRSDPFGRDYYWFSGEYFINEKEDEADDHAVKSGYVSITPVEFNFTENIITESLKNIFE